MTRWTTTLLLLVLSAPVAAQEFTGPAFEFDHVALSVADVQASQDFYESMFGMVNITNREPIEGVRWLRMQGGGELHLLAIVDGEVRHNQAVHFAVRTPDFDAFFAKIVDGNVEYTTWLGDGPGVTERDDGTRQIYIRDPDGYWIEIIGLAD